MTVSLGCQKGEFLFFFFFFAVGLHQRPTFRIDFGLESPRGNPTFDPHSRVGVLVKYDLGSMYIVYISWTVLSVYLILLRIRI